MFSLEEVERALPSQLKGGMTPEIVANLNKMVTEPEFAEQVRDNLISYTSVLRGEGRFRLEDYINAVVYVSYKLMGYTDKDCYMRTFPDRYALLVGRGASSKDIAAYVSAYNRGVLVNKILEQTLIPSWVLNQDLYQRALNVQADLMLHAKSEKVRTDAANSILNHLKKPDAQKVELSIGVKETDTVLSLHDQMRKLVESQQALIRQGVSTREIAHQVLIQDAEVVA